MKFNSDKTSSRRKMRKAHFGASSVDRRKRMSCGLSKDLQNKLSKEFKVQKLRSISIPVIKGDEVKVVRGQFKDQEGKVTACYRKKYVIHVEKCTREKQNKQVIPVGIDASNCIISKLKMDKSRKAIIARKVGGTKGTSAITGNNLAGVD
jgi:large subunit ribosomal protein L26e